MYLNLYLFQNKSTRDRVGGAFTKKRLPNGARACWRERGVVTREVEFNTERCYTKTMVRLEFFNVSLMPKFLQNGHRHIGEL